MMTRESIIRELNKRGFNACAVTNEKNGVAFEGILMKTGRSISPVIYTERMIEKANETGESKETVVDMIVQLFEKSRNVEFSVEKLMDKEFILSHVFVAVQKEGKQELVKRNSVLEGIEAYLYIRDEIGDCENGSIKLTVEMLEMAGISVEEAWERAMENLHRETEIENLTAMLCGMVGEEFGLDMETSVPLYILTNRVRCMGAGAILDRVALQEFAKRHHTKKIVVFPSSVHEMILLPDAELFELDVMSQMVADINASEVSPEERLTDRAYILEF